MAEIVDSREILARIRTERAKQEPPRPLMREMPPPDPFPTQALGGILSNAAIGIPDRTRAPIAICGQSVMATATLVTQGHADVRLPTGQLRPSPISSQRWPSPANARRPPMPKQFGQFASARKSCANSTAPLDRNMKTPKRLGNVRVLTPQKLAKELPARSRRRSHSLGRHQTSRCCRF